MYVSLFRYLMDYSILLFAFLIFVIHFRSQRMEQRRKCVIHKYNKNDSEMEFKILPRKYITTMMKPKIVYIHQYTVIQLIDQITIKIIVKNKEKECLMHHLNRKIFVLIFMEQITSFSFKIHCFY